MSTKLFIFCSELLSYLNRPIDERRPIWIANSGNESLKDINTNLRKVFCQDHFDPKYLRCQFNRTILRKDAVPYPYNEQPEGHEIGEWTNFELISSVAMH